MKNDNRADRVKILDLSYFFAFYKNGTSIRYRTYYRMGINEKMVMLKKRLFIREYLTLINNCRNEFYTN